MPRIVTLTVNPSIDESCSVDRVVPEHKLRCSQPSYDPGGGGLNVARAIHQLGGKALALWMKGGPTGELLHHLLDMAGISHRPITIDGMTRQNMIVYENTSGLQFRFGMPGPVCTKSDAERGLRAVDELDDDADFLVLSGSLPPEMSDDFMAQLAQRAPKTCRVVIDTSGKCLKQSLAAPVFLIKPNLRELGLLVGKEIESDPEIVAAAREIIDAGRVEVIVVSIGSGGALLVTADVVDHVRSPTVPIRSKVGAGDSMVAGIVLHLSRGGDIREAVRFGVAAGSAAVMNSGTTLCKREDTERLFERMSR